MPLSDQDVKSLFEKAEAYEKLGNYEEALKVYEKIIELKPDYAKAWKNKGDVLSRLNRYEEARNAHEKAAEYYLASSIPLKEYHAVRCYFSIIANYIFSIESKEVMDDFLLYFTFELDGGTISNELRELFTENKHPLSEEAKVKAVGKNLRSWPQEWRIKDGDKVYINIKDSPYKINVYLENAPLHSSYYYHHALLCVSYDGSYLDTAIADLDRAIELEPGRWNYYKCRGEFLLRRLWEHFKRPWLKICDANEEKSTIEKVITDYKSTIERNPSDSEIWLSLMELNILLHNWDDTISIYGSCRPYIDSKEGELVRSWLGCVALALAGDPIEDDDRRPLYDKTIRLKSASMMSRIISNTFINKIQGKEGCNKRWEKAVEIHKLSLFRI